jgi:hypothetical protein
MSYVEFRICVKSALRLSRTNIERGFGGQMTLDMVIAPARFAHLRNYVYCVEEQPLSCSLMKMQTYPG